MKNYHCLFILILCFSKIASAQSWNCINGQNRTACVAKYRNQAGQKQKLEPRARNMSSGCLSKNVYYLFGGFGFNELGMRTPLNDLWQYDLLNKKWMQVAIDTNVVTPQKYNKINEVSTKP